MDNDYTIFFVDDIELARRIAGGTFGKDYAVELFDSGKACLERLVEKTPDIFLLDVDMPEMNGFALCRLIKAQVNRPVIFISGLDDLESRLMGYDAGGDDFIVKPFKVPEIKQKIEVHRRIAEAQTALQKRLDDSDNLSTLVLSNLDEYAVLIKFLRALNRCEQHSDVADAILEMLRAFHLEGAVQFRLPTFEMTFSHAGEATPLQASIILHVRNMGTIAEFKSRAVFNYERVSILINNMPLHDPDLSGRLRDHLAMAVETTDVKLLALQTRLESTQSTTRIAGYLSKVGTTVGDFSSKYERARYEGSEAIRTLMRELDLEFASLGLLDENEEQIKELIRTKTDHLIDIFDFSAETEKVLNELATQLGQSDVV